MTSRLPATLSLPAGYRFERELTRPGAHERVVQASSGGRFVALRIAPGDDAAESLAELAVLAAVEHPGLAALVGHGVLAGGDGTWIAREWIEGSDLASWARDRDPEEIGRMVARLCPALEALHERGFVHGDLKPSNVLVASDDDGERPVLTDFGLARRADAAAGEVSGTYFGLAPELLIGGRSDARADLFALGVMLHELLVRRRTTAREFYGRFPTFDFFTATDTTREELPDWARDLVAALVEREPSRRPASAAQVGSTLAGRLGLAGLFREPRVALRFPIATGCEAWIEAWLARSTPLDWLVAAAEEDVQPLCDELALRAALKGSRVQRVDLRTKLTELRDGAALDAWAVATCGELAGARLFVALAQLDPWSLRAVDSLARAMGQSSLQPGSISCVSASAPELTQLAWRVLAIPGVSGGALLEFVREHVAGEPASLEAFAEQLDQAARGSAVAIDRALERCAREGWLLAGDERPRLRSGALPTGLFETSASTVLELGRAGELLLAALRVCGGETSLEEAAELAQLDETALSDALAGPSIVLEHVAGTTRVRATSEVRAATLRTLDEPHWRALHERRAERLEREGASLAVRLPHLFRARRASPADVAVECERLRDAGCAEIALALCDAIARQSREAERALDPRVSGERALAWAALGQPDRALEALAALPSDSAIAERARGQVASLQHEPNAALAHFQRARELDPDDGGLAQLGHARLLNELQRDRELIELVDGARTSAGSFQPRVWASLLALHALSLFRTGEVERARTLLERFLAEAREAGDATREAALSINLATVERRAGGIELALEHFQRAAELYERAGVVTGLAQARAMLGATLRDLGELQRAQPLLQTALAMRERLGDHVGATAVRGMLGLTLAERGHARPAIEELERSARTLRESSRVRDAVLLETRADEMRTRLRSASDAARTASEAERAGEGDPRTLVSLARTAWLRGDAERAHELAARAEQLARSLGLSALLAEAVFLVQRLAGRAAAAPPSAASLVEQDELAFALLSRAPFDFERARELARELAARGRDDRAARLSLAVAARAAADAYSEADWKQVEDAFARCAVGCSSAETDALRQALLGVPEPWPEDVVAWDRRRSSPEEDEMEVVRLLEINHRLVAQEDLRTLLGTIVEQALAVSGAQRGFLILEEEGELEVDTALDSRRGGIDAPDVEVSGSVLRDALAKMKPVRVSNAIDDPLLGVAPSVVSLELRSILCVPFEVQKDLRGVVYVDHRLREGAFDARAERMLTLLADQAALAIGQVRRLEEIRRLNRELGKQMARKESDLRTATQALRKASLPAPAGGLVGDSEVMQKVRALIERAAQTKLSVLVTGPSGSGKELAARALHELGPRAERAFVSENCAALPESLIEAELFGARRGAFTGAERDRDGLFVRAHGGTLFLDEIGELPLDLQAKLLRVLETSQVRRLGDDKTRTVDFRLVAATNRDLAREVREGRFRADLFYRLDGLRIEMPALAAHAEDIPALVDHCLRLQSTPAEPRKIAPAVLAKLCRRDWPGNVRELFNEVARLLVLSQGDVTDESLVRDVDRGPLDVSGPSGEVLPLEELERRAILRAIEVAGGDKRKAAELLGISRAKVYQRLKEWNEGVADGDEA